MFEGTNEHTFALARELVIGRGRSRSLRAAVFILRHSTAKVSAACAALSNLQREGPLAWIWVTDEQMQKIRGQR